MQIYFHLVYFSNLIFYLQKPQKLKIFFWRQLFLLVVECLQFKISHHRKEISKALREENTFKTLSLLFLFSKWCLSVLARLFSWPHCTNIGKNKEIKKKKRSILNLPLSIKGMVRVRSMSDCLQGNLIFFLFCSAVPSWLHDKQSRPRYEAHYIFNIYPADLESFRVSVIQKQGSFLLLHRWESLYPLAAAYQHKAVV